MNTITEDDSVNEVKVNSLKRGQIFKSHGGDYFMMYEVSDHRAINLNEGSEHRFNKECVVEIVTCSITITPK